MNRFTGTLLALLLGATVLTSCLRDDDDDATTYADMAITQFTLGTLNRYITTISTTTGNDSLAKTTIVGSNYKMTIDHMQRRIYNETMLPMGTDVEHVLCTVTTKNGGVVALMSMTSDSLRWHSATDSVSFAQPRTFRVYANNGTGYRDYTVALNVSTTTGTTFGWQLTGTDDTLAGWTGNVRLAATADGATLVQADSIVGRSTAEFYTIGSDGMLRCSADGGATWTDETLDADATLLPAQGTATAVTWPYATAAATDYVLMVGAPQQADEPYMRVWRKLCPQTGGGHWTYMPFDDLNHSPLPRQQWFTMACLDGTVLAVGSNKVMLESPDQGITWKTSSTYALPSGLTGTRVLLAADEQGALWMLTDTGQLWKGTLR